MTSRKEDLDEEKEEAVKTLDDKYKQLSLQFATYGSLITQMEAQFSGLKMMIENPPD